MTVRSRVARLLRLLATRVDPSPRTVRVSFGGPDYTASMKLARQLAEDIYNGDGRPDLKNGRPLDYSDSVGDQHRNHVHAAVYAKGGYIPGPTLIKVKLHPDECVIRRDGTCVRADHPTATSDCSAHA